MSVEEISHTADCAILVRAPDLRSLLEEAARGLYQVAGVELAAEGMTQRGFSVRSADNEGILVAFLSELLYYMESQDLAFDRFELHFGAGTLDALANGGRITRRSRLVKAVTFHNLAIRSDGGSLQATIVFDV